MQTHSFGICREKKFRIYTISAPDFGSFLMEMSFKAVVFWDTNLICYFKMFCMQ